MLSACSCRLWTRLLGSLGQPRLLLPGCSVCLSVRVPAHLPFRALRGFFPSLTAVFSFQWIMDVILCNGLGIYCGMKTLSWLSLKTYKWQGLWNIPTYK